MFTKKRTMILCLILICLLVLIGIFTVAGFFTNTFIGPQTVKSETSDMTIKLPQSWIAGLDSGTASISMTSKDAAYAVLTLEEKASEFDEDMSLETYSNLLLESMKKIEGTSEWDVGDLSEVTVGENTPGLQRTFTVRMDTIQLKYQQTVFRTDDLFIEILAWSTPDDFRSAIKIFDTIVKKVTPPTSASVASASDAVQTPAATSVAA